MKVRVVVTLDIDAEAWAMEYAVAEESVRDDVKKYAPTVLEEHFRSIGVLRP